MKVCLFAVVTITAIAISSGNSIHRTSYNSLQNSLPAENRTKNNECNHICETPACIHEASRILRQMDKTADPCQDFYNFACGNFIKETIIPDEQVSITTISIVKSKLWEQLHSLISEEIDANDLVAFSLPKKLYRACVNKTQIEENGLKPLIDIIDRLGGWPVVRGDEWDTKSEWNWTWAVKEFRKFGFNTNNIFSVFVEVDSKNSSDRIISIDQAVLGLSANYLINGFNDKIVKAYYAFMVDVAVISGADRSRAEQELKESLEFEMKLANISVPNEKRRNFSVLYNPHTLREMQQKYPYIQWLEYMNSLLTLNQNVNENEMIIVKVPCYFERLGQLLQNTPKRVIANYMIFRIAYMSSFYLTDQLRNRQMVYFSSLSGVKEQMVRWKECTDLVSRSMPTAVSAMYIRKHFRKDSKAIAQGMVNRIRYEMKLILNNAEWMDDETRQSALKKLRTMSTFIGYPDELMDNAKIEKYYENLDIDENNYLLSILNMFVFATNRSFSKLHKMYNKTEWTEHVNAVQVNALYYLVGNGIEFPAGILQDVFFSSERPQYLNYGGIGAIIGHEITHGFDDKGRQFDLNGNLVDWWQPETKSQYLEKAKCIIEQYGNYTEPVTGLRLNGINTQGENIADNGGIKASYLAYRRWQQENGPEKKLPGLQYNPQQMFWIATAQNWCSKFRPESMKSQVVSDAHIPGQFRVLGSLRNRQEFADDFNCPAGSPMNPTKKCEVW